MRWVAEKPILLSKKRTPAAFRFVLRCIKERGCKGADSPVVRQPGFPREPATSMIMKFCPNYRCIAYGRVVYTQITRCVFCRWDLKPPRMKSETATDEQALPEVPERSEQAPASATRHPHKTPLRPSA